MKWYRSRYAYPLIVGSLLVSVALQAVWLRQLFLSQRVELAKEMEAAVSKAASQTSYVSLTPGQDPGSQVKEFFLSPQWLKMRQAFDDVKQKGLQSNFHYTVGKDSSSVEMRIVFSNQVPLVREPSVAVRWNRETPEELQRVENRDIAKMDSLVRQELMGLGVRQKTGFALYDYAEDTLNYLSMPSAHSLSTSNSTLSTDSMSPTNSMLSTHSLLSTSYETAAYRSGRYSFNFKSLHKYQLVVGELNTIVVFRMRYFLLSSLLMVLLTGIAFYFLLRLIRNQRLYAEARIAFTSNMTHELKTPVATVAVALESITRYQLVHEPEKLQNYLDISRHELQRLNLMIEKVLNLSHEKEIGHPLHQELYDVQAGLQQAISSMQVQLDSSRSVIQYHPSPEPCFVLGDPLHLMNVFYNLIDNAIKYAGPGLELKIDSQQRQGRITIHFKDNGPGIAGQYQERIFERYFRVPAGGDIHNTKGSGLGLHYVREIVEQHGGSVTVKSEPGKGSNFIVILPVAK